MTNGSSLAIVFINLDRAVERRRFMEDQGRRLGLAFERLDAVVADAVTDDTVRDIGRSWERPLTKPELGCFLSHHALWTRIAAGDAPMLVLEDDVVLSPRVSALLDRAAGFPAIDLLNLESVGRRRFVARTAAPIGEGLQLRRVFRDKSGSGAYILWPAGARKLLRRAARGAAPVDAFLHGLKGLGSYQVDPALAMQAHLLAERGMTAPIPLATFIHAPRGGLALSPANLPFHLRRMATQVQLAGQHAMRLFGRRYRRVDIVAADFAAPAPADQRRS